MLCFKLRRKKGFKPAAEERKNGIHVDGLPPSSAPNNRAMSVPLPVTEDTPPDMLAGAMDLQVVLPNGREIKMSVQRSTPMMDLLVHITTANKISPGGHVIQAVGDRGVLPYKPSTPIGALDTWTIRIVPKKQLGNAPLKRLPLNIMNNTPFEQTFRLQVHLPRNQLYVTRVGYKTCLSDVLQEVCREKNLDATKYCLTYPDNMDDVLDLSKTFCDYKIQQLNLVSKSNRPVSLSAVDIMSLKCGNGINKSCASHSCEGSVSSGSLECRSVSPVRSDQSSCSPPISKLRLTHSRPYKKRRPAPKPPQQDKNVSTSAVTKETAREPRLTISHSRNSSDSSGYHESSILSESPESTGSHDTLQRRSKLPSATVSLLPNSGKIGNSLSKSLCNLASIAESQPSSCNTSGIKSCSHSVSTTSLSTSRGGRKKKPAPLPPVPKPTPTREEETADIDSKESSQILPPPSSAPHIVDSQILYTPSDTSTPEHPTELSADVVDNAPPLVTKGSEKSITNTEIEKNDLVMNDDEIDRLFYDATKNYETGTTSLDLLPSPPPSITDSSVQDWQYKLPEPPSEFRDDKNLSHNHVTATDNMEKIQTSSPVAEKYDPRENTESPGIDVNKSNDLNSITTNDSGLGSDDSSLPPYTNEKMPPCTNEKFDLENKKICYTGIRPSTLNNFSISTYQNTKPTEIFHDDSIKTSKTTELAKSKHPALQESSKDSALKHQSLQVSSKDSVLKHQSLQVSSKNSTICRCNSFSKEKVCTPSVKRSMSHISLLSGNYVKFSKLLNSRTINGNTNINDIEEVSSELKYDAQSEKENLVVTHQLRKTASEISVNKDCDAEKIELLELQNQVRRWREQVLQKESNLVKNLEPELQSLQVLRGILPRISKMNEQNGVEDEDQKQWSDQCSKSVDPDVKKGPPHSRPEVPNINLSSWNERPKQQIGIKMDKDYTYNSSVSQKERIEQTTDVPHVKTSQNVNDSTKEDHGYDMSHVPIVRAVEFKKPFTQIQSKSKRPTSCYFFGDKPAENFKSTASIFDDCSFQSLNHTHTKSNKTRVTFSTSLPYENSKFKSIMEINRPDATNLTEEVLSPGFSDSQNFRTSKNTINPSFSDGACRRSAPVDTRDRLLESIRTFNRDGLKRIRTK